MLLFVLFSFVCTLLTNKDKTGLKDKKDKRKYMIYVETYIEKHTGSQRLTVICSEKGKKRSRPGETSHHWLHLGYMPILIPNELALILHKA